MDDRPDAVPRHRPRPERARGARLRVAHPRPRRLAGEPVGPHHLGRRDRRGAVGEPVGNVVVGGAGPRHPAGVARRIGALGRLGRHRRRVHPHRAAPRPARRADRRAQPSLRRDRALVSRCRAGHLAPERVPLRRRARVRRRVRRHGRVGRGRRSGSRAGRQGDRACCSPTTARSSRPRRSAPRATARSPSSACAGSRSTRCRPGSSCGRCRRRPRAAS